MADAPTPSLRFGRCGRGLIGCAAVLILAASEPGHLAGQEPASVTFTWLSNTTWLIEAGETRVLADAAVSRIALERPDVNRLETLLPDPIAPDLELVEQVFDALEVDSDVAYILVGHGHTDHTIDLAPMARLTGAQIVGSRTACLQAEAQGIAPERCRIVEGGERLELGPGLHVRVIRWAHSGNPADPLGRLVQAPAELVEPPAVDPVSGAIAPSPFNGSPNGGGARAYLFTYESGGDTLRWLVSDTGNALTFDGIPLVEASDFEEIGLPFDNLEIVVHDGTPREWLTEALREEGTAEVDAWLAYFGPAHVRQVTEHLRPAAVIPHHWGGFTSAYTAGVNAPFRVGALEAYLDEAGIVYLPQAQYLERYRLTSEGLVRVPNAEEQRRLGLTVSTRR